MKKVLIIGATSGIGEALAKSLDKSNYEVFGTYNKTETSIDKVQLTYLNVLEDDLDLSHLPDSMDALVYCPGSIDLKPFHRIKLADFEEDLKLQFIGAIKVIQRVLNQLKNSRNASIILFSTIAARKGFPFHTMVGSSKAALEGLTKSLAAEFAPLIRVNCIAPSLTETRLSSRLLNTEAKKEANEKRHPLQSIGTAQNIADMAEFLISDRSSWITGQILAVDGGLSTLNV